MGWELDDVGIPKSYRYKPGFCAHPFCLPNIAPPSLPPELTFLLDVVDIPTSYRYMPGFGVHTLRLLNMAPPPFPPPPPARTAHLPAGRCGHSQVLPLHARLWRPHLPPAQQGWQGDAGQVPLGAQAGWVWGGGVWGGKVCEAKVWEECGQQWSWRKETLVKFHWLPKQGGCGEGKCVTRKCGKCVGDSGHGASKDIMCDVVRSWGGRVIACCVNSATLSCSHFPKPLPLFSHLCLCLPCA